MKITFAKLRQLKVDLGFDWKEIREKTGIHATVIARINKDQFIKLESLVVIIEYLNNTYGLSLDIGDLVSIKPEQRWLISRCFSFLILFWHLIYILK